jgi:hypothetical protein
MTIHRADIMHGVTKLHGGSRYSLFVLDQGAGLGDDQVLKVDRDYMRRLLHPPSAASGAAVVKVDENDMKRLLEPAAAASSAGETSGPAVGEGSDEKDSVSVLMQRGFQRPLAQFLERNAFDCQPLLLQALLGLGAVTMEDVHYGLMTEDGLLTVAELEQRGCPPIPARRFIRAAAAAAAPKRAKLEDGKEEEYGGGKEEEEEDF